MVSGCWTEDLCKSLSVHFHVYAVLSAGVLTAPYKRVRPRVAGLLFMMPMVRKFLNRPASACAMFFKDFLSWIPKPVVSLFHPRPDLTRTQRHGSAYIYISFIHKNQSLQYNIPFKEVFIGIL